MLTLINPVERAKPFDHADRPFEVKFDGFRAAADTVRGSVISRNGNRMQRFEEVRISPESARFQGLATFQRKIEVFGVVVNSARQRKTRRGRRA